MSIEIYVPWHTLCFISGFVNSLLINSTVQAITEILQSHVGNMFLPVLLVLSLWRNALSSLVDFFFFFGTLI